MLCVRCPICGKELRIETIYDLPTFPFCSRRCRIIDTGRWLGGEYRIPGAPDELEHSSFDEAEREKHSYEG
ncbi:MAG: DNA gyrase inhibitor YacG [Gemmatales bacterium]|nr:DNA gyrase inhibitor YacG [Gemmatales bacterium]MDW7995640.1 DNA gyrase inhibitor YacG [Gemmatales bacterium]